MLTIINVCYLLLLMHNIKMKVIAIRQNTNPFDRAVSRQINQDLMYIEIENI